MPLRSPTPAMYAMIVILALVMLRMRFFSPQSPIHPESRESVTVRHVIDGDTIDLADDRRVRLLGIDAPEEGFGGKPAEPSSEESTAWLRMRIEGREMRLRVDSRERDRYGRLLAWVFEPDGTLINELALSEGHARLLADYGLPADLEPSLRAAECEAKLAKRGMWATARRKKP